MTTLPSLAPLHVAAVGAAVAVKGNGSVIVTSIVVVQPLASVMVNVCVPAVSPVCAGVMLYGAVPPAGVMTTLPSLAPLHDAAVGAAVAVSGRGSVIVTSIVAVQPLTSVMVNVCVPAVSPVCAGVML